MEPIVTRLRKLNIEIGLVDNKLKINGPKGVITAEVLQQIKEHKDYLIDYIRKATDHRNTSGIKPAEKKEYYRLSSAQKRLYVLYEFDRSSIAYNEMQVLRLDGKLNKALLQKVFNELAMRHESLRTVFAVRNGEPVQIITAIPNVPVAFFEADERYISSITRNFAQPFDLNNGPLIRVGVIDISDEKHVLIVDMHHIITDALSEGVLMHDFLALYNNKALPGLSLQYKDYAEWQQSKKRGQEVEKQKGFWLKEFETPVQPLQLPASFDRPLVKGGGSERVRFHLGKLETRQLKEIANREGASSFMLLLSLYNVLLGKLSHQEDIVVGIPMADRQHPALEHVIGIFVNTLALRNYPQANSSFRQFLADLRARALACFDHPAYPYEMLIEDLKIVRDSSRNPLFDVWFIYQNYEKIKFDHSGLSLQEYDHGRMESKFDIVLEAYEADEQFHFNLSYANELFTAQRIDGFIGCLRELVKAVISDADVRIGDIELFPEVDASELLPDYTEDRIAADIVLPASYHQERMWFIDKFECGFLYEAGPVYHNIPLIIDFNAPVDAEALHERLQQLVDNYSVLRTQIITIEERPYQKIAGSVKINLHETGDIIDRPFRLDEVLIRAALLQGTRLVLCVHHSIADRHTMLQLGRELLHGTNRSKALSYAAFTLWQQEHLQEQQFHLLAYWKQQLGPKLKALELPMDRPRAAIHIYKSAAVSFTIPVNGD
ncbi:MAG TPA: condensation domain-containing protein, partial [Chitinophagaceae bacterium]|nr:condensation domain-containing protein [Chitinophagaceae bacterium]